MVYQGLLWVGALQVDPGWVGYLPCPIYNMSDDEVTVGYRTKLFTIDFVRTTPFHTDQDIQNIKYPNKDVLPPLNPSINFYDENRLRSAPYEALRDLGWLTEFRNFSTALFAVMFTAIAAIIAALGVIVIDPIAVDDGDLLGKWALASMSVATVSFVFSLFSIILQVLSRRPKLPKWLRRK